MVWNFNPFEAARRLAPICALLALPVLKVAAQDASREPSVAVEARLWAVFRGNEIPLRSVTYSPDWRWLAAASDDGTVRVWRVETKREVQVVRGDMSTVNSLTYSPDGRWIATASDDGMVRVWEVGTGREVQVLRGQLGGATGVAYSPDGLRIASASNDDIIRVWQVGTRREAQLLPGHGSDVTSIAYSPDGRWIASASDDGTARVWEATTGREAQVLRASGTSEVTSVSFSPDGRWLAVGSGDRMVRIWEVGTGREAQVLRGHEGGVTSVAFSGDRRWLASGSLDGTVRMWDVGTGRNLLVLRGHTKPVTSVASSADGQWLASASEDGTVRVWIPQFDSTILGDNSSLANRLAPKDQFETSAEFSERIRNAQVEYVAQAAARVGVETSRNYRSVAESRRRITLDATSVTLGEYNADTKRFTVTADGFTTSIEIVPAEARELARRQGEIIVEAVEQLGPDLATTERVNRQLVHPTTLRKYPIGPQVPITEVAVVALRPARLEVVDPRFTDTDGDNQLGAGERAVLQFMVRNSGEGPGQALRVVGTGTAPIDGLNAVIGRIEPGETRPVTLTLVGGDSLRDGTAELQVEVREANGFNAAPLAVRVPTRAFRRALLEVAEVGVEDAQGRAVIRVGQVVTLTLRVRNAGEGRAAGVIAEVVAGTGVFLAETDDARRTMLRVGDLEAGAHHDVRVKAFANTELRERFPLSVSLREATGRYAMATRDLGLALETPQRSVAQLDVSARTLAGRASSTTAGPRLASDLLDGIPRARAENADAIAVIIGNRSYQNAPGVAFATNDAAVMRQYAERALGIRPGNVIYMEDATLTNLQVVFGREGDANGRLRDLVKPGVSEVFVFYSGHGAPDPREERAYLMPVDADASRLKLSGFSVDVLYANLAALGAKHVTVVLDACFSGATGGGEMLITEASPIGIRVTDPAARFAGGSATILTASSAQQLSNWYPERRHGLFTYFFLKGLQGSADADRDGTVTVGEMRTWLTDPRAGVPYESRRLYGTNREQVPQVWGDSARRIR